MKTLSIKQPWAWCILHAGKDVENRKWKTKKVGWFLIHASKQIDKAAYQYLSHYKEHYGIVALPDINSLQTGGIIGAVELIGCIPSVQSKSVWADNSGFCFQLRNPVAYRKTIPCKGKLSFFDTPMVDELQIEHAVALQKIYNVPFK